MAFSFNKRIELEAKKMKSNPPDNCSGGPIGSNIMHWKATIIGPNESPYEGGIYELDIKFPNNYPFKAPSIKFITKIYHPNISRDGEICLDILKAPAWSPALRIPKVLMSICSLLTDPNPDDPLTPDAANLYKKNRTEYDIKAREWTNTYASGNSYDKKKVVIKDDTSSNYTSEESESQTIFHTQSSSQYNEEEVVEEEVDGIHPNNNNSEDVIIKDESSNESDIME